MKYIFTLYIATLFPFFAFSQWQYDIDSTISESDAWNTWIEMDKTRSIPYVVYVDTKRSNRATVVRQNGNVWEYVGIPGFTGGAVTNPTMCFDKNNLPYVAYTDGPQGNKSSVMRFNGSTWEYIGNRGFSDSNAVYTSIAIDDVSGEVFVAYRDLAHANKASMKKFDGTQWSYLGSPGFSPAGGFWDGATCIYILLDNNGTPFVSFCDLSNNFKTTVMKFDGSTWIYVGAPAFSNFTASDAKSMAFDSKGNLYITCSLNGKRIMKFNGSVWSTYGPAFSSNAIDNASIIIDCNDSIYVAYKDITNGYKISAQKFDGSSWHFIGGNFISNNGGTYPTLAVDRFGELRIAFRDGTPHNEANNQFAMYPAAVKQLTQNYPECSLAEIKNEVQHHWTSSIFPNPSSGEITVNFFSPQTSTITLQLRNQLGQTLLKKEWRNRNSITETITVGDLPSGVYFIQMSCSEGSETKKIIVE